jgi:multiple sugar transport system permease protein
MSVSGRRQRTSTPSQVVTMGVLIIATLYFLLPVWWLVVSATKSNTALFDSNGFWFSGMSLLDNIRAVFSFDGGSYARWLLNSGMVWRSLISVVAASYSG